MFLPFSWFFIMFIIFYHSHVKSHGHVLHVHDFLSLSFFFTSFIIYYYVHHFLVILKMLRHSNRCLVIIVHDFSSFSSFFMMLHHDNFMIL